MKIIPLSEGSFTIDKTKEFVPFDQTNDNLQERSRGSLLVEIQPFLVVTSKDVLLLDAGLGFSDEDGILQIHQNMALHGIYPSDVTKVLMTHLHKDHAGGLVRLDTLKNEYQISFPQADYYISQREIEVALGGDSPSYNSEKLSCLLQSDQVHLLQENNGLIDGYIRYEKTGGHSPFHQVFYLTEGNQIIFFGGDEAPQLQQMKTKFVAKYDADGKRAMELRVKWWEIGNQENWKFLFYHDIKIPTYQQNT
jgi:glyoxylase-like metal-dependent hydrolase (beta-lactamase superfamily II)